MTLTIHKEEDEQRQMLVKVEVEEGRVQKAMRQTAKKIARDIRVPGFRKGKAPFSVLASYLGGAGGRESGIQSIRVEAIESLVQPVFEEMLAQIDTVPYVKASFDDMEIEPLVLTFTIPMEPVVTLGDYRSLREEVEPVVVTDEAVEDALNRIQSRHAALEDVDRPVELGDLVTLGGHGELVAVEKETAPDADADAESADEEEDLTIFNENRIELVMDSDMVFTNTPFVENIVGMSAGEEKTFTFTFPEDHEDEELAGREATFTINVINVQKRELPALDDELAKLEGNYETLDELSQSLRKNLQEQGAREAKDARIEKMVDGLLENAEMVYPPAAVESEIDDMLENFKAQASRSGWEWEDFLRLQGNTEEAMRDGFRETAVTRLQRQLALRQFVLDEKLRVNADDVDAYIDERVGAFGENAELQESMRSFYRSGYGFDMISSEILLDKADQRIVAILSGEAPDLAELAAETAVADEEE